jgi:hypothetical protein
MITKNHILLLLTGIVLIELMFIVFAPTHKSKELLDLQQQLDSSREQTKLWQAAFKQQSESMAALRQAFAQSDSIFNAYKSRINEAIDNIPDRVDDIHALPVPEQELFWTEQTKRPQLQTILADSVP